MEKSSYLVIQICQAFSSHCQIIHLKGHVRYKINLWIYLDWPGFAGAFRHLVGMTQKCAIGRIVTVLYSSHLKICRFMYINEFICI